MTVAVRQLAERDLPEADRIFRLAFGTFIGLPDPLAFAGDTDFTSTRWKAAPELTLAADSEGRLAGSNFIVRWGSFGFFGPLSVHPEIWNKKIGQMLVAPVVDQFDRWRLAHTGLYTFAQSTKHVSLYQKFGFQPHYLTSILIKKLGPETAGVPGVSCYSELPEASRADALRQCASVSASNFDGLDLSTEIDAVAKLKLGDTLILDGPHGVEGFAVCHCGAGTEAGSGNTYIKFGAVRNGARAPAAFERLLGAVESFTAQRNLQAVIAGVNTARSGAFAAIRNRGYRPVMQGVGMQRPDKPGFNRPDVYILDDWR